MPATWNRSIRYKLAILIAAILAGGVAAYGVIAYRSVRQSVLESAYTRLQSVATQFADMTSPPLVERVRILEGLGSNSELASFIRSEGSRDSAAAAQALQPLGPGAAAVLYTEIVDRHGTALLTIGDKPLPGSGFPPPAINADAGAEIGPLFFHGDSLYFSSVASVLDGGALAGHVVQVRRATASQAGLARITDLIGQEATLLMGNVDGSIWTDMNTAVDHPPPTLGNASYTRDGRDWLSRSATVDGTPFVVAIEFPEDLVLQPARSLARNFMLLALLIILVGATTGWLMSQRMTRPLVQLTAAAEEFEADHASGPVSEQRDHDEIEQLTRSLFSMMRRARLSHDELERRISERTLELREALTQLRGAQEELVRKERLAILGQLSSSVGHELRNPLGVMTNAVYYLEASQRDAPEKVRNYLEILRNQIRLSEKIVADLLDFARIKPPQLAAVKVDDLVKEQVARVSIPHGIAVNREIASDLPALRIDSIQIGQVLLNLLTNAIQAMDGGEGILTISAAVHNGAVRIVVADTGPGVPTDLREKIFEPLFTTKARGIGLGLSVSQSLTQANGGRLDLLAPDLGAAFSLDLPVADTQ